MDFREEQYEEYRYIIANLDYTTDKILLDSVEKKAKKMQKNRTRVILLERLEKKRKYYTIILREF
jgi:hypothetical protein